MKIHDQMLDTCELGKETAKRHIETAQGFFQDAGDQGNVQARAYAKEAIDIADLATASYQEATTQIGRGEPGIDALERGSGQLILCEDELSKAASALKASGVNR
jgi:hypothetical protein